VELRQRQEMYQGFGNTLARAVELVVTPMLLAGLGYLLDRWLGLFPLLSIVFFVWAFAVTWWRQYHDYNARMQAEEDRLLGRRSP
jgi:F0F1-type ATP synthase assembly protein I